MSDPVHHHEFVPLPHRDVSSDEDLGRNPVRPALNTLFSEFARRHRSLSPSTQSSPRSLNGHIRRTRSPAMKTPTIDLRSLEYDSDYDSHLMCPICHIPFVDPVVLECDHTFCSSCFTHYRNRTTSSERTQCPSCRSPVLASPRRASRLIYNMCNDIKVQCPNEECQIHMARCYIERHATRDCPDYKLICPDVKCGMKTKRKNYIPGQCVHNATVQCDCGAVIELGRGEWLKHKDQSCPNTGNNCADCGERLDSKDHSDKAHVCPNSNDTERCPGIEFGCTAEIEKDAIDTHRSDCIFARLAPHLKAQSLLVSTLQEQLVTSKLQNETLEMELERVNYTLTSQIQPRLEQLTTHSQSSDVLHEDHFHDHDNDIEEIPRDSIPSAAAIHHRDLLLPAHIRDLTPSPDPPDLFPGSNTSRSAGLQAHNQAHIYNHLSSMHDSLRHIVSGLEADIISLHHALTDLDARTSLQIANETLRIKEDLAYTNANLMSHRSQVQYLLNRERIGREQAILRGRERVAGQNQQHQRTGSGEGESQPTNLMSPASSISQAQNQSDAFPFPNLTAGMTRTVSGNGSGSGSGPSSAATSPIFSGIGLAGAPGSMRRPSMRGGSQERVKL